MKATLERLFDHLGWADRRALAALSRPGPLPATSLNVLAHLVAAEQIWLSRLRGVAPAAEVWPSLTLPQCRVLSSATIQSYRELLATLDEAQLAVAKTYRNSAGKEFTNTAGDMLLQVVLHGAYHRGQIAASMRLAGLDPVNTDFITFARE